MVRTFHLLFPPLPLYPPLYTPLHSPMIMIEFKIFHYPESLFSLHQLLFDFHTLKVFQFSHLNFLDVNKIIH